MNNKAKLKIALESLGAEYQISMNDMIQVLQAVESDWEPIDGCPKYQMHSRTGVIRNRSTHRILKPNNSGYVKVRDYLGKVVAMKQGETSTEEVH